MQNIFKRTRLTQSKCGCLPNCHAETSEDRTYYFTESHMWLGFVKSDEIDGSVAYRCDLLTYVAQQWQMLTA
eukprot:363384-Chlamydomonas_euryale.AAC.11